MKKGILFEAVVALVIVFLAFTIYAMISTSTTAAAVKWTTPTYDQPRYMYASGDILYSFTGNSIYAIESDGHPAWNLTIPDKWRISTEWLRLKDTGDIVVGGFTGNSEVSPTVAAMDGVLYVYARPNITVSNDITTADNFTQVFAISKDGIILWSVPLESKLILYGSASLDTASIHAYNGRIYVFHDYKETVIDSSGHVLFTIAGVSDPAAVDEHGNIYAVAPVGSGPVPEGGAYYRVPSSVVNAYDASGNLLWSQDIGEPVIRQYLRENIREQFDSLPLYREGKLYLPLQDGILAMNADGTISWVKRLNESTQLLELMPMDSGGNFYLEHVNNANLSSSSVYILSADGSNVSDPVPYDEYRSWNYKAGKDGMLYYITVEPAGNRSLEDLDSLKLTAYDVRNASALWTYTIPTYKKSTITLDDASIRNIFDPFTSSDILNGSRQRYPNGSLSSRVYGQSDAIVLPSEGRVYVSYTDYNYEYPIVPGQSQCVYAMGVAAINSSGGRQEWQYSADSPVTAMAEGNGTLFYSTMDGKITAAKFDPATGLTIAVVTYMFIRFFMFGAVSRARSRLDKNENRNVVLKFISEHPGSTLYEIARGIDMNLGTARYHVLILGINHRITSQKADNKYVRFFLNSNTFSKEEQVLLSFIKREPTRKVLGTLLEKPGRTNVDLSRELDIAESTISKYIKELSSKEIIMKEPLPGGRFAYSIRKEYVERVAMALESLKCAA